jgi:hypothetical protein
LAPTAVEFQEVMAAMMKKAEDNLHNKPAFRDLFAGAGNNMVLWSFDNAMIHQSAFLVDPTVGVSLLHQSWF